MTNQEKTLTAINLLKDKAELLGRLPQKSDFDSETVCFIKQKLGPWPRALEAAGLKAPPVVSTKEKSRLKRLRSRKNRKLKKHTDTSENAVTIVKTEENRNESIE